MLVEKRIQQGRENNKVVSPHSWTVRFWYFSAAVFVIGVLATGRHADAWAASVDLSTPRGLRNRRASASTSRGSFHTPPTSGQAASGCRSSPVTCSTSACSPCCFRRPACRVLPRDHRFWLDRAARMGLHPGLGAAFLGLMLLILHRMLNPVTRRDLGPGDYIGSWLIFLVMLTGCLALARSTRYPCGSCISSLAELLLIYFPFSALMHTFTFQFSRGFMGAHYGPV